MVDSLIDFLCNNKLMDTDHLDPCSWELNTYMINRRIYDDACAKLDNLGYKGADL